MVNIVEISSCQSCKKTYRKNKLILVEEYWITKKICRDCYVKFQRSHWGYW